MVDLPPRSLTSILTIRLMKTPLPAILSIALVGFASAQQLPVGSVTNNRTFTVRGSTAFKDVDFADYKGKILVIMMMTPWCPECQTISRAVGEGILDHYDSTSRGTLRGKNANGIEIHSILLSTEEAAGWDDVNASFASTNGYEQWGLDANAQRENPRRNLGYFRGGFIDDPNLYAWGSDRRRLVVVNLVEDSASHSYREILLNQNSFSSSNYATARNRIDAVEKAPVITAPAITANPQSVTISSGGTATLRVTASGTSPTFQWYIGTSGVTSNPVSGAVSATYTTPALTSTRTYWVRASNAAGNDNSAAATVTVTPPPPTTTTFNQWSATYVFPAGESGLNADPDRDGMVNMLEFYHGTHPLQGASVSPGPAFSISGGTMKLIYRRAKNLTGFTLAHRFSDHLGVWQVIPDASLGRTIRDLGTTEEVTVTLPATTERTRFYQLSITQP